MAISTDFLTAYSQIPRTQQKKVREFVTRFQTDPTMASINYEPIHDTRDERVRTVRIDLAYRAVVLHPQEGDIYLLVWVDNHDEAMRWARNKTFEINPLTGALQVLDTEALAEAQLLPDQVAQTENESRPLTDYALFETFSDRDLLRTGLPLPLLPAVRSLALPTELDALQPYIPAEAFEALFWIANLGHSVDQAIAAATPLPLPDQVDTANLEVALSRPDSMRRFAFVDSSAELLEILSAPLEKWRIFLHPSQADLVRRHFNGPARVLGGAGTGKTVVAMHRARYLAHSVFTAPTDRVLFTTFTRNLANNIQQNLDNLCGPERTRIEVINLHAWAVRFLRAQGVQIEIATPDDIDYFWEEALRVTGRDDWSNSFFRAEWTHVIQAYNVQTLNEYLRVGRIGRGGRLNRPQRAAIWPVFAEYRRLLTENGHQEWLDVIRNARLYLARKGDLLPYRAIVVDETQDLHPEELQLLRQMVPPGPNDLFFVGDAHQRIYGTPVIMSHCGIHIVGRSAKLRINYRTTEEIRRWSTALLAGQLVDNLDGALDPHTDYLSLMSGLPPEIHHFASLTEEQGYLAQTVRDLIAIAPSQTICIVARSHRRLREDYLPLLQQEGIDYLYLEADTREYVGSGVRLATMHRVKGLEFAHVLLVGVNENVVPPEHLIAGVDASERADVLMQERCLLHVAASRARETLHICSYGTASQLLLSTTQIDAAPMSKIDHALGQIQ